MGNNASSLPRRRSSSGRDSDKPHVVHKEYASPNANGLGPVKLKSRPVTDVVNGEVYQDRHHHGGSSNGASGQGSSEGSGSSTLVSSTKPTSKVTTPSIILDDLVEGGDYFSNKPDTLEVSTSNAFGDEDDGYGIDEDLVSPVDDDTQMRNVNLKFTNEGLKVQDYVYVIGSFDHWSRKVMMEPDYDETGNLFFKTVLTLPMGIYRVKFLVNGYLKHTNDLPTATDKSGNFVNWFEVGEDDAPSDAVVEAGELERHKIIHNARKSTPSLLQEQSNLPSADISRASTPLQLQEPVKQEEYSQEVPLVFHTSTDPDEVLPVMDEEFIHKHPIPELPVYLNNNYLNKHFTTHHTLSGDTANLAKTGLMQGLNSHIIPHVNLKHLLTSNIKNGVLGVACTTRYSGKFVTQIMYSPASDEFE